MRKTAASISVLFLILFFAGHALATCPAGSTWTTSWTDSGNQTTYTLEAPCKVYIGIPFTVTATATDSVNPNNDVAYPWAIYDTYSTSSKKIKGTIAGGAAGGADAWITTVNGQWQKTVPLTYSGTPYDHRIEFYANDLGYGTGSHSYGSRTIGDITVDPFFVDAGADITISASQQSSTILQGRVVGSGLTYRWLEGSTVLQDSQPVDGSGNAPLNLAGLPSLSAGAHTFTLAVTDGSATASDTVVVSVSAAPANAPPLTPVPVMESWWLLPGIMAGIGIISRRRRKQNQGPRG